MNFVNIGYGNLIAATRIVAVVTPDSAPIKRLLQDAKEDGRIIDVSGGKKTRAVLIADTGHVILCALQTETIAARLNGKTETDADLREEESEEREFEANHAGRT